MASGLARAWPKDRLTWRIRINLFILTPFFACLLGIMWWIVASPYVVFLLVDRVVCFIVYRLQGREVSPRGAQSHSFGAATECGRRLDEDRTYKLHYGLCWYQGMERPLTPEVAAALTDPRWGQHMSVEANGLRFHAVAKGERGKPLMLFLHGFPESW
jgi:hypothetical protein